MTFGHKYKFANATADDLRRLLAFMDTRNPQGHVLEEIRRWTSGEPEFDSMDAMLAHFDIQVDEPKETVM